MRLLAAIIIIMPPALPGEELPWPKLLPGEEEEEEVAEPTLLETDGGVDEAGVHRSLGGDLLVLGLGLERRPSPPPFRSAGADPAASKDASRSCICCCRRRRRSTEADSDVLRVGMDMGMDEERDEPVEPVESAEPPTSSSSVMQQVLLLSPAPTPPPSHSASLARIGPS
jgi:hypothetical protein